MLKTKSVWTPVNRETDGLRILASRFRGRGLKSNRYNVWMASLGPSEQLLRAFQSGRLSWPAFEQRYTGELFMPGRIDARNKVILNHGQKFTLRLIKSLAKKGNVTLMCQCDEDEKHCHRHLLRKIINSAKV